MIRKPTYRRRNVLKALCFVLTIGALLCVTSAANAKTNRSNRAQVVALRSNIQTARSSAWFWQKIALVRPSPTTYQERRATSISFLKWLEDFWANKRHNAVVYARHPPHLAMWLCIHTGYRGSIRVTHGEAAWKADIGNGYYGGLQMGDWFMGNYAPDLLKKYGTADHWLPLQQIWVAEDAYQKEGYSSSWLHGQWPKTSPPCI